MNIVRVHQAAVRSVRRHQARIHQPQDRARDRGHHARRRRTREGLRNRLRAAPVVVPRRITGADTGPDKIKVLDPKTGAAAGPNGLDAAAPRSRIAL